VEKSSLLPTLLVVDDSVENLQILSVLLKDLYKIKIAKNGEKALEIAQQSPQPDLILLDVMMPGMDGFEVCSILKGNPITHSIPVIFLTALNEVADETKGFQLGGADFIIKPFNPDIVKARIKTHLDLQSERRKSESLLKILLPEKVIDALIANGEYPPEKRNNVSILFCDFVGFTSITATLTPETLFHELTEIFTAFDEICDQKGVTRIKTIGDAYMAASGILEEDSLHSNRLVDVGLAFIEFLKSRNEKQTLHWQCRIGIHSGSVIAGIVGKSRFIYDILGDDVNIAARVESAGTAMRVAITDATKAMLSNEFTTEPLGNVMLKGKGEMQLHFVNRSL
jgi:class 3 adenylate cyclase